MGRSPGIARSMARKPRNTGVGGVRMRAVRGPDEEGRWYWRAEVYAAGSSRTVWTGWATKPVAERTVAELVARDRLDQPSRAPEIGTVHELLGYFRASQEGRADLSPRTVSARRACIRHLDAGIGDVRLEALDRSTLERYRDRRLRSTSTGLGAAPRTVRLELEVLGQAWQWGREQEIVPARDFPSVSIRITDRREKYTPSRGDVAAVVAELDGWTRLAVHLLYATGCRPGELAQARWKDVDFERGLLHFPAGKTGPRSVPLLPVVLEALSAHGLGAPERRILGRSEGTIKRAVAYAIDAACASTGIRRFTPYGMRRLMVDTLAGAGVDVGTAAQITGHTPEVMLRAYRQVSPDDRTRAARLARLGYLPEGAAVPFKRREPK